MDQLKKRKCKNCGEEFQKKFPLQYLCSPICETQYKRMKEESKGKKKKPIALVSQKRLSQLAEYRELRKEFLRKPENHYCPVMKHFTGAHVRVTDIHHMNGRENNRLNDTKYWLAVSRQGHTWIHEHPEDARELGWLI